MAQTKKSIRFKMTFPEKVVGDPIMHRLSREVDVIPNILRGRITEKNACLEVELVGSSKNVSAATSP